MVTTTADLPALPKGHYWHDPQAVLDYHVNLERDGWLAEGEVVISATWAADSELTIGSGGQAPTNTGTVLTVWLSGGTVKARHWARVTFTTSQGRSDQRTITLHVIDR